VKTKTRRKIKNIVSLVRKRRTLKKELKGLDEYKQKIGRVKQRYEREKP
jgi:hypothetical protein